MEELEDLIDLQNSHVNQYTDENGKKSVWEVQKNKTNEVLAVLPKELNDEQVFKVLHFARDFELLAFNIGMKYMQKEMIENHLAEKSVYMKMIDQLKQENERLAEKLEELIGE